MVIDLRQHEARIKVRITRHRREKARGNRPNRSARSRTGWQRRESASPELWSELARWWILAAVSPPCQPRQPCQPRCAPLSLLPASPAQWSERESVSRKSSRQTKRQNDRLFLPSVARACVAAWAWGGRGTVAEVLESQAPQVALTFKFIPLHSSRWRGAVRF